MQVGCVIASTIAGRNCGEESIGELEGEDTERRYVRDANTSRDHTGTIPGAEDVRGVATYARVASADRAGRAIRVTRLDLRRETAAAYIATFCKLKSA